MRFTEFRVLVLAILLLGSLALVPELREAQASGSTYTAQCVGWAYGTTGLNDTGIYANTDDLIYTVNWRSQAVRMFPLGNFSYVRLYLSKTGSPTDLSVKLYSNGGDEKPGSLLATWTFTAASISSGAWNNLTLSPRYTITSSGKYHIVLSQSGGTSGNYYIWGKNAAGAYQGTGYCKESSSDSGATWSFTTSADYSFEIYYVKINRLTTSSSSEYWGSGSSRSYRVNFTYAFPSGAPSKSLNVTYIRSSYLNNVTTQAGALVSSSSYTDSVYNGTHRIISLSNSGINTYGNSYSLYSHEWPVVYWLTGLSYENGTHKNSVTVTMANSSGSWDYTLSYTLIVGTSSIPEAFSWSMGSYNRLIKPISSQENFTITYFDGTPQVYLFDIRDFIGITAGADCYLESWRNINGTDSLIERQQITDTINGVPLTLTQARIYKIEIWDSGQSVRHEFGYFLPTSYNTEPVLTLQDLGFTDQAQMVSQYVRVEASRDDTWTSIVVIYNNTLSSEYNADASLLVKKRDGTVVYNSSTTDDAHTWTVPGLTNSTDYLVFLTITHEFWGTLKYSKILAGVRNFFSPPDLGVLGTWGGIPSGNILSAGLILLVAGLFSFLSAGVGIFIVVALSAGLLGMGWISSPSSGIIIVCLALAVMLSLSQRLRR